MSPDTGSSSPTPLSVAGGRTWYVSYGSNVDRDRFLAYFDDQPSLAESADAIGETQLPIQAERWVWLDYLLYFAGHSQTWNGPPAFVTLVPRRDAASKTLGRGYLLSTEHLAFILAKENGRRTLDWALSPSALDVGAWAPLPTSSKYNAVLRLPDIDGSSAVALTTSDPELPRGRPPAAYLDTCRKGLTSAGLLSDVDAYLSRAVERSMEGDTPAIPVPRSPIAWSRAFTFQGFVGFPAVRISAFDGQWFAGAHLLHGHIESGWCGNECLARSRHDRRRGDETNARRRRNAPGPTCA
jgi:hypothetical protein